MIISTISIRTKLLLTTLVTVITIVVLAVIYMDSSRRTREEMQFLKERSSLNSSLLQLNNTFQQMLLNNEIVPTADFMLQLGRTGDRLRTIAEREEVSGDTELERKSEQLFSILDQMASNVRFTSDTDTIRWNMLRTHMKLLNGLISEIDIRLSGIQDSARQKNLLQLGLSIMVGICLIIIYLVLFSVSINTSIRKLLDYTHQLKLGKIPPPLEYYSDDEFARIACDLNSHASEIQKKIRHISSLSSEGPSELFEAGEEDELGNALVLLTRYLSKKELEEVSKNREDKKQNWISEGIAQIGEVLRSERQNVTELSFLIIQKLVTYMNLEMGSLFITNESDPENLTLDLAASYAFDRRKYLNRSLPWGSGLPGTCALEKERIFLTEVPADYFEFSSGTGSSKPNCILLVPLKIRDNVFGVIELATARLLRPFEIDFVESLSESIASSIRAVKSSEKSAELLKQSQAQAQELKQQESVMLENMKQLEHAQEESRKKESEIAGILNAINQSTLVAEFGVNGRFSSINERFLIALESQKEQVLGKLHSDFAHVEPYSDEYRDFWASLREGMSQANIEKYKLFSGKELWLQQTFTPIINNEGKVYKILDIAVDITENLLLQEKLESQDLEITRRSLDMKTLNEAVNIALVKCELDADGIIMEVNNNYTELTGYGRKELLGRNYRLFLKENEKEQFERIWEEVKKEKVYEGVVRRSKPTGEQVWLVSTFSPVKNESGIIYKVYFMGLDITEKRLKYQLLEDANHEIERLRERLKNSES